MGNTHGLRKSMRLTETAIAARFKRHGPRGALIAEEFLAMRDGTDIYADRINMGERIVLREQFLQRPALKAVLDTFTASVASAEMVAAMIANRNFSVLGTNMTTALCVFDTGGGIKLKTAGADADSAILLPALQTNQTLWSSMIWPTSKEVHWHALVKPTSATLASSEMWAGLKLTNTPVLTTDADFCCFKYDAAIGSYWSWNYDNSNAGPTAVNCATMGAKYGVASPTKDLYQLLSIIIDENRYVTPYIDGVPVADPVVLASVSLIPYVGVLAAGASAEKSIVVRELAMSRLAL